MNSDLGSFFFFLCGCFYRALLSTHHLQIHVKVVVGGGAQSSAPLHHQQYFYHEIRCLGRAESSALLSLPYCYGHVCVLLLPGAGITGLPPR